MMNITGSPTLSATGITKKYGSTTVLDNVNLTLMAGQVHCLLGDNGAGKSTLIKILSGALKPTSGSLSIHTKPVTHNKPQDALNLGIATVYQDLAIVPMMSITRNFFLGHEPTTGRLIFKRLDMGTANTIVINTMKKIGIHIKTPDQPAGTLSGGERQVLAIARAVYFGAKALILDEPTSALGVTQTENVLRAIKETAKQNIGIILITHNARHAIKVGDAFTILRKGRSLGTYQRTNIDLGSLQDLMAGDLPQKATTPALDYHDPTYCT